MATTGTATVELGITPIPLSPNDIAAALRSNGQAFFDAASKIDGGDPDGLSIEPVALTTSEFLAALPAGPYLKCSGCHLFLGKDDSPTITSRNASEWLCTECAEKAGV